MSFILVSHFQKFFKRSQSGWWSVVEGNPTDSFEQCRRMPIKPMSGHASSCICSHLRRLSASISRQLKLVKYGKWSIQTEFGIQQMNHLKICSVLYDYSSLPVSMQTQQTMNNQMRHQYISNIVSNSGLPMLNEGCLYTSMAQKCTTSQMSCGPQHAVARYRHWKSWIAVASCYATSCTHNHVVEPRAELWGMCSCEDMN